ncbi:MAG: pyridoxal phosphate-dependent aminotransferase [Deltaproteobacteria bacterium]|nr:pyridoxal phosphate-dependent aminotransferase [Deltaproteobacteria bacterium]
MAISTTVKTNLEKSSWIRKMFEQGALLKKEFGADRVFDFSLGNPNLEPPQEFFDILRDEAATRAPGRHGYMSNVGYAEAREKVAEYVSEQHGLDLFAEHVVLTCGAGGALNVLFKTLLDPGDEVIVPSPYFVEYNFYIGNHGGVCTTVPTDENFMLNTDAIAAAITPKTKAVLINSPNNPTGRIYGAQVLAELGRVIMDASRRLQRDIYLVSDEPYAKIVFDNAEVPSMLQVCPNSILITSYSKDLSIPGERIGYIAVNPGLEPLGDLMNGLAFAQRTLGFVNAPAIMQRVIARLQGVSVDTAAYQRKRDLLCGMLHDLGYRFVRPEGAFYLFPRSPVEDDVQFVQDLLQERILVVPGSGFGRPGHFRIAYCVDDAVITGAADGFTRVAQKYGLR